MEPPFLPGVSKDANILLGFPKDWKQKHDLKESRNKLQRQTRPCHAMKQSTVGAVLGRCRRPQGNPEKAAINGRGRGRDIQEGARAPELGPEEGVGCKHTEAAKGVTGEGAHRPR